MTSRGLMRTYIHAAIVRQVLEQTDQVPCKIQANLDEIPLRNAWPSGVTEANYREKSVKLSLCDWALTTPEAQARGLLMLFQGSTLVLRAEFEPRLARLGSRRGTRRPAEALSSLATSLA